MSAETSLELQETQKDEVAVDIPNAVEAELETGAEENHASTPSAASSTSSNSGSADSSAPLKNKDATDATPSKEPSDTDTPVTPQEAPKDVDADDSKSDDALKKGEDGEKKEDQKPSVSFGDLFRFADSLDKILLVVGSIAAAANGSAFPLFSVVFGEILDEFGGGISLDAVNLLIIYFVILGGGVMVASTLSYGCWLLASERMTKKMREEYLRSALRQNIGWFDEQSASVVSSRLSSDAVLFSGGTGDKVAILIQHTSTFFVGLSIGFAYGWHLALVVLGTVPLLSVPMGLLASTMQKYTKKSQETYEAAGEVASDAISSVRTVSAFGGQNNESKLYEERLDMAMHAGVKKAGMAGLMLGIMMLTMFSAYGLSLWFGGWLIRNQVISPRTGLVYTGGDILTIFFVVLIGAMSIGQAAPSFPAILDARVAAHRLFEVIDRKSPIDYSSTEGKKLDGFSGDIELKDVHFRYPTREDLPIFQGLNVQCKAGETIAVVGVSGGGKSTMLTLIERYYDADEGAVLADGVDVKELNVRWWRKQIGYVKQEPLLFRGSVRDNIKFGTPEATEEDIIKAATDADAHDFIMRLDDGYDTEVGDRGSLLSGGQKQRVAIARAIIRNPKILLLDEATSALDSESERVVQKALDKVMQGRTTIIVAHRLSTVRNADKICVVQEGEITEEGPHDELMKKRGAYYHLVHAQQEGNDSDMKMMDNNDEGLPPASVASHKAATPSMSKQSKRASITAAANDEDHEDSTLLRRASESFIEGVQTQANVGSGLGFKTTKHLEEEQANADDDSDAESEKPKQDKNGLAVWEVESVPLSRVFALAKGDWQWVALGCLGGGVLGGSFPVWALVMSDMINLFYETDFEKMERDSAIIALIFFGVGVAQLIAAAVTNHCFGLVGERITRHLRGEAFKSMLRQEMGWFDHPDNNARVLTSRLESDASEVQGAAVGQMPALSQALIQAIFGLGIGFYYSWRVSLVLLACAPVLFLSSIAQMKMLTGFSKEGQKAHRLADRVSGEATSNIRTVAAFTCEDEMIKRYSEALDVPLRAAKRKSFVAGLNLGSGLASVFFVYALVFWYGSTLVRSGTIEFLELLTAMFAIMMTAMGIGNAVSMSPDFRKAKVAKDNIFHVLDRKSAIDPADESGEVVEFDKTKIAFEGVEFTYPSRPDQSVLNGFSLATSGGSSMALVGESGAGKSTIVSLLQRFYNPTEGRITIDGHEISKINLQSLRSQMGLVEQEPSLFNRSIRDNIRYGRFDATDEEVEQAAKSANIHDSIMEFPEGYDTPAGAGGSQLSGGQKQRVAIARAILRSPRILLLDEATSALDSESEKVVQAALDNLMDDKDASRATIVIAHRLSTIQKCDKILVMDRGTMVEIGSHEELLKKNGAYANLSRAAAMKT